MGTGVQMRSLPLTSLKGMELMSDPFYLPTKQWNKRMELANICVLFLLVADLAKSLAMSSSFFPTAASATSSLNSSIYTALSSAIATNSSIAIPTSTMATATQSATLSSTSSFSSASPSFNPTDCILQPYEKNCFNITGTTVNSAQNVAGLSAQMITCSSVGVLCFLIFCVLRTR